MQLPHASAASELKALGADVAIIGAPVDMGVVYRPGARFGPRAIRQASYVGSSRAELHHLGLGVNPLEHVKVVDFGDANCPPSALELAHDAVRRKVSEALEAGSIPVVLGGDHSITLPSATAVAQFHGEGRVGVIHFDAHADTGDESYGGVFISHGSPMRRLIESGAIPGKNFCAGGSARLLAAAKGLRMDARTGYAVAFDGGNRSAGRRRGAVRCN